MCEAGFKYIDLGMGYVDEDDSLLIRDDWKKCAEELKITADKYGAKFIQAHSPGGNPLKEEGFEELLKATLRSIEVCGEMGIKNIVVHAGLLHEIGKEEFFEKNKQYYQKLFPTAEKCGVNILCENSTAVNAGIIKAAVEFEQISPFNEKLLVAAAIAQKTLGLPIVLHTNAINKNAVKALDILLANGVKPQNLTVGHLSDTNDAEYISQFAAMGCYIALDRLHNNTSEEYISGKVAIIEKICDMGYGDKILLSHDDMFFTGFCREHKVEKTPRFEYVYKYILPKLGPEIADMIMRKNPVKMLEFSE